jgi:hypothetical protein
MESVDELLAELPTRLLEREQRITTEEWFLACRMLSQLSLSLSLSLSLYPLPISLSLYFSFFLPLSLST